MEEYIILYNGMAMSKYVMRLGLHIFLNKYNDVEPSYAPLLFFGGMKNAYVFKHKLHAHIVKRIIEYKLNRVMKDIPKYNVQIVPFSIFKVMET